MLLGQRPDSGGGTLQSTCFFAFRLQYGPDAAATMATDVRQGRDGSWHLAHGLDRALCWWQVWDADTATAAKQPSALRSRTGTSICRKQNLQLLAGGLPSLCCDLVGSPQRKWLSASARAGQQRAGAGDSGCARLISLTSSARPVLQQHPLTPAWAPLSSTPQGPHDNILKV